MMVEWVILPAKTSPEVLGKRKRAKGKDEISDRDKKNFQNADEDGGGQSQRGPHLAEQNQSP